MKTDMEKSETENLESDNSLNIVISMEALCVASIARLEIVIEDASNVPRLFTREQIMEDLNKSVANMRSVYKYLMFLHERNGLLGGEIAELYSRCENLEKILFIGG